MGRSREMHAQSPVPATKEPLRKVLPSKFLGAEVRQSGVIYSKDLGRFLKKSEGAMLSWDPERDLITA